MPLVSLLRDSQQSWPEETAIWFADRGWKFGELDPVSDRIAAGLAKAGACPGDRIALFTPIASSWSNLTLAFSSWGQSRCH